MSALDLQEYNMGVRIFILSGIDAVFLIFIQICQRDHLKLANILLPYCSIALFPSLFIPFLKTQRLAIKIKPIYLFATT